jgi:hypothetical protein
VGGAIGGGLYLAKPSLFTATETSSPRTPDVPPAEAPVAPERKEGATMADEANGSVAQELAPSPQAQHTNSAKTQETAKSGKAPTEPNQSDDPEDVDVPDIDVPDVEVRNVPGGIDIIKTVKGKTTVTHVNTGPRAGFPNMPDMEKALRGIDRSKLTPEQRRKLQQAIRMGRRPPANTPDTPQQP